MRQIFLFLLIFEKSFSQSYFSTLVGKPFPYVQLFRGSCELPDSTYAVSSTSYDFYKDTNLIHIIKLSHQGVVLADFEFGLADAAYDVLAVKKTGDNFIVASGEEFANDSSTIFLLKINTNGDSVWMRRFTDNSRFCFNSDLKTTSDGGYILTGLAERFDSSFVGGRNRQMYIIKTDSLGNMQWQTTFGDNINNEVASDVVETPDSGFIVVGRIVSPYFNGDLSMLWIKLDKNGVVKWSQPYGVPPVNEAASSIIPLHDGTFLIGAATSNIPQMFPNDPYGSGGMLVKVSPEGFFISAMDMRAVTGKLYFYDLIELPDHSIIVTGFSQDGTASLAKLTENSDLVWKRDYERNPNPSMYEYFWSVIRTLDHGYLMTGQALPEVPAGQSNSAWGWALKVDSMGCEVANCVLGVEDLETDEYSTNELELQPNPASDIVTIKWGKSFQEKPLLVHVFDISGRLYQRTEVTPGEGSIEISLSGVSAGVYFVQILSEMGSMVKKLVVE